MNSMLSARKRADTFDALISGLDSPARRRADLAELAPVVTALRQHTQVAPRPDFAASLRELLMTEAATVLTGEAKALPLPTRRRGTRERRLVAAATAAVFIGGTAGMAVASQNALPGDTLYPIKRTIERAQAGLNTNDAGKGHDLLAQASDRLGEVKSLLGKNGKASPQVPGTINDFSKQAQEGADLLVKSFEDNSDPKSIESVRNFAASSLTVLQELAKTAPPDAAEALANAAVMLQQLDSAMLNLCGTCASDLPPLQVTNPLLASSSIKAALEKAASLEAAKARAGKHTQASGSAKTGGTPSGAPSPTKAQVKPSTGKSPIDKPVGKATDQLHKNVDKTVAPIEDLLDQVLPGAGTLLGDLTNPLLGP
jgi:hypothetical protein